MCLNGDCHTLCCGRDSSNHAVAHFKQSGHAVVMNVKTAVIWCYLCDDELKPSEEAVDSVYNVGWARSSETTTTFDCSLLRVVALRFMV
jgi:uncharacterized UBP type Zn finger protein